MKTMNMNRMQRHTLNERMRCCCGMQMMRNEKEGSIHITYKYKERQTYEKEHFYHSIDFRAAA